MQAVKYGFRKVKSVPMYDQIMDSFHVLIDDELVEIPAKLFHKMFKPIEEEDNPFESVQALDRQTMTKIIDAVKNQEGEMGKEVYELCKQSCKVAIEQGLDKNIFKLAIRSLLVRYNMQENASEFETLIDKIYNEIENEN